MTYALGFYILASVATAVAVGTLSKRNNGKIDWIASATSGIIWPLWWTFLIVLTAPPMRLAKCAWCGKEVAWMNDKPETLAKWREHYLNDCGRHPLQEDEVVTLNYWKARGQ